MKYQNNFFDLIVDKSTIDCLLTGPQGFLNTALVLRECQRILKVGGFYVAICFGNPETRLEHL